MSLHNYFEKETNLCHLSVFPMTLNEPESDLNPKNKDKNCTNFKISCHPASCITFSINRLLICI